MQTPNLERIVERLNELRRSGVIGQYAIGGAFAFVFYAEPIETLDLDVFADQRLRVILRGHGLEDRWEKFLASRE